MENALCPICGEKLQNDHCRNRLCDYNFKDARCLLCFKRGLHFKQERPMKENVQDGKACASTEQCFVCKHCGQGSSIPLWNV